MGLNYIWIDSLCIIQDDHDDWLAEAESMSNISERVYVTLMAAHAQDRHNGMFTARPAPALSSVLSHFFQFGLPAP